MPKTYKLGKKKYLQSKKHPYDKFRYGAVSHVKDKSTHGRSAEFS